MRFKIVRNGSIYALVIAAALMSATVFAEQPVYSSKSEFDQGYADGREARLNSGSSQAYCDPNNSASNPDAYCAMYKSGYWAGWNAAGLLYDDQNNN